MIIKNPHTDSVKIIYGPQGNGVKYEIQAGETVVFSDVQDPVAQQFLDTFGFLEKIDDGRKAKGARQVEGDAIIRKMSRSEMEDKEFMARNVDTTIQGRTQTLVNDDGKKMTFGVDGDGVGWYGGIESDNPGNLKSGKFN